MLTVVTFLYKPRLEYWGKPHAPRRVSYCYRDVNILAAMVARHLRIEHRFVCITDDATGIDKSIKTYPLWPHAYGLKRNYRRLRLLSEEVTSEIGDRHFLQLDLDTVIMDDITALIEQTQRATIWQCPSAGKRGYALNPSMLYFRAGELAHIWHDFQADPRGVANAARSLGFTGTDQSIFGMYGDALDRWTDQDGVMSYRDHVEPYGAPPDSARVVGFYGDYSVPDLMPRHDWIADHWRREAMLC